MSREKLPNFADGSRPSHLSGYLFIDCLNCGYENPRDRENCIQCARSLRSPRAQEHYWTCPKCDWAYDSPDLNGPMGHALRTGHIPDPTGKAIARWGPLLWGR